jgi:hypothetical protein
MVGKIDKEFFVENASLCSPVFFNEDIVWLSVFVAILDRR